MSQQNTTTDLLSKKRENIFDDYLNFIEQKRMTAIGDGENEDIYNLVDLAVQVLERTLQDITQTKPPCTESTGVLLAD
ncbi:hypothetical protein [uncultured Microscilla sp.]|uniref:hypothetical protein n=1 Tax=uncultured Microscilla sp. TaxID=432653 RepID=UPI00260EB7E4|nr:hypothetical protein [uncultured Microscilla sp.]